MPSISERVGRLAGLGLAPLTATLSAVRQSRLFHPSGVLYWAKVTPLAAAPPWGVVARRLTGPAVVRLSGAWWKRHEWPDVLGCAIRFTSGRSVSATPRDDDQDLLLATVRRPWTLPWSPLTTEHHDFLANDYYGVSPFVVPGHDGLAEWRLSPECLAPDDDRRERRLARAVARGSAGFRLEARPYRRRLRFARDNRFMPVSRIVLIAPLDLDQEALRFDPFRAGRGIEPAGLVHALRIHTYAASQRLRPRRRAASSHRLGQPDVPELGRAALQLELFERRAALSPGRDR